MNLFWLKSCYNVLMGELLEKAKGLNTENVIRDNFALLKKCYNVDNAEISRITGISIEQLIKIDNAKPVSFSVYDSLAGYFGVYTSDLFSEVALKDKLSLFATYMQT